MNVTEFGDALHEKVGDEPVELLLGVIGCPTHGLEILNTDTAGPAVVVDEDVEHKPCVPNILRKVP